MATAQSLNREVQKLQRDHMRIQKDIMELQQKYMILTNKFNVLRVNAKLDKKTYNNLMRNIAAVKRDMIKKQRELEMCNVRLSKKVAW